MKILIADDDPVSRTLLAKIIETLVDHQTTEVADGYAAWLLLDDPVVFLDLLMPKIDGFELLKRIRSSPILKSTEVVVCSGAHDRASVIKAAQLGARHYLVKPCSPDAVLAKLRMFQPV
jgi:CheY-like chemotaxis protein